MPNRRDCINSWLVEVVLHNTKKNLTTKTILDWSQFKKFYKFFGTRQILALTVSGQNKIGRELFLLVLIQPTVIKQQAVNNNWL